MFPGSYTIYQFLILGTGSLNLIDYILKMFPTFNYEWLNLSLNWSIILADY
jgi:hypothetical protein